MLSLRPSTSPQSDLDGKYTYIEYLFALYSDFRVVAALRNLPSVYRFLYHPMLTCRPGRDFHLLPSSPRVHPYIHCPLSRLSLLTHVLDTRLRRTFLFA